MVEAWMLLRNLQERDFDAALSHADVLLRTHPDLQRLTAHLFLEMTMHPGSFQSLVDEMSQAPPWRRTVLADLTQRISNVDNLEGFYDELRGTNHPPTMDELRPYLNRLIASGRYQDAYRERMVFAGPKDGREPDLIPFDGDFSSEPTGMPFDWVLNSEPGARVDIVPAPGSASGRALHVQFSGARVSFRNVSQLLLLAPGEYHLSGLTRATDLDTTRGLWWRVECADQPNETLAQTDLVLGTLPWTSFDVDFRVPANGCRAQQLELELPARTATEHRITGEVWYRNIRISSETAEDGVQRLR
jgi:hypothetical protein